jgi:transposase-like protein
LTQAQWRRLLYWFVRGFSGAAIAHDARLNRQRVLRALTIVRRQMLKAIPMPIRDLRDRARAAGLAGGDASTPPDGTSRRPTRRTAMLGIFAINGIVWAEVVPAAEAHALRQWLVKGGATHTALSSGSTAYAAIVDRGHMHRLALSPRTGGLIGAFWAHAQRQLMAKGGIRLERLELYLAESSWRYNHRRESRTGQLRQLLALARVSGGTSETFPAPVTNLSARNYFELGPGDAPKPSVEPTDVSLHRHGRTTEALQFTSVATAASGFRRD